MTLETTRLHLPFLAAGQAQKELTHNEALAIIDTAVAASCETFGLNAPPATPMPGQCWVIGPSPSNAWSDHAEALACWTENGWRFVSPLDGLLVWIKDQQLWAARTGGSWSVGDVRAAALTVGGQQVVGARQASVTGPTGGTVVDVEARAVIANLIDRLAAHGLIAL